MVQGLPVASDPTHPAGMHRAWAVTGHQDTTAPDLFHRRGRRRTVYPQPGAHSAQSVLLAPRHAALSEIHVLP
jgi:hypothetical protein